MIGLPQVVAAGAPPTTTAEAIYMRGDLIGRTTATVPRIKIIQGAIFLGRVAAPTLVVRWSAPLQVNLMIAAGVEAWQTAEVAAAATIRPQMEEVVATATIGIGIGREIVSLTIKEKKRMTGMTAALSPLPQGTAATTIAAVALATRGTSQGAEV